MKALLFDIETMPTLAYIWALLTKYVPHGNVAERGYTACFAAKWLGKKKVTFRSVHHHSKKEMLQTIWEMLNEADVVIHYNGTKFDVPTLNLEFLEAGMPPPSPFIEIDLYRTAKGRFRLLSNSLAFLAKILGLPGKLNHKGMELWTECRHGNAASWKVMKAYNIQDVLLLEQVYKKLLPWIQPHPNMGHFVDAEKPVCPTCGSNHLQSRGSYYTATMRYQRYQCMEKACGKWSRARTNDLSAHDRRNMLVGVK